MTLIIIIMMILIVFLGGHPQPSGRSQVSGHMNRRFSYNFALYFLLWRIYVPPLISGEIILQNFPCPEFATLFKTDLGGDDQIL